MSLDLGGTRSTVHYLAQSANILAKRITTFSDYVFARIGDWEEHPQRVNLRTAFKQLDCYREKKRDSDKLALVEKSMLQLKTDIKSLQLHVDMNVGMVSYSEASTMS